MIIAAPAGDKRLYNIIFLLLIEGSTTWLTLVK